MCSNYPPAVHSLHVRVMSAGEIASGASVPEAIAMGYTGVHMGTRFIATTECTASEEYNRRSSTPSRMRTFYYVPAQAPSTHTARATPTTARAAAPEIKPTVASTFVRLASICRTSSMATRTVSSSATRLSPWTRGSSSTTRLPSAGRSSASSRLVEPWSPLPDQRPGRIRCSSIGSSRSGVRPANQR